jgi:hypothetical protein
MLQINEFRGNSSTRLRYKSLTDAQKRANHMIAAERNIRTKQIGERGEPFRSIIATKTVGGKEYRLHATKGWRVERSAA